MLLNVIDKRKRPYRWKNVDAFVEPTCHDNGIADADQVELSEIPMIACEDVIGVSVAEALRWANAFDEAVTLFLSDAEDAS